MHSELLQLLKPITIRDKPLFDKYFSAFPPKMSEMTFTTIFCWAEIKHNLFCEYKNHLLIAFREETGSLHIAQPIGPNPAEIMQHEFGGLTNYYWSPIEEEIAHKVNIPHHKPIFDMTNSDYVYKIEDLVNLKGDAYHGKRNFVRRFEKLNPHVRRLTQNDALDCLHIQEEWLETQHGNPSAKEDSTSFLKASEYKETFPLHGIGVFLQKQLVAFAIGEPLNNTTFVDHFEKALPHHPGAYQFLLHEFAKFIPSKYKFLNREQDLGIPGLRKSKESWHPAFIQKKYTLKVHPKVG